MNKNRNPIDYADAKTGRSHGSPLMDRIVDYAPSTAPSQASQKEPSEPVQEEEETQDPPDDEGLEDDLDDEE